jgi:hypothetical protein
MNQLNSIETSIYICRKRYKKLQKVRKKLNIKLRDLISILICKGADASCKESPLFKTVDYQPKDTKYKVKSLKMYKGDWLFLHSCKSICRKSSSFIIRECIDLFLDDILENGFNADEINSAHTLESGNGDNYPIKIKYKMKNIIILSKINKKERQYKIEWKRKRE